jgi:hypothetical protein
MSKSIGEYNVDNSEILISKTQKEINDMYDEYGIEPVLLRGLYNSGDTLVLNDMLLKHSVVSPQEIYEFDESGNKIMTIKVATSRTRDGVESIDEKIRVCPQQILPSERDLNNRGVVRLGITNQLPSIDSRSKLLSNIYGYGDASNYIRTEFGFVITPEEEIPMAIPEMNFDINEYARFLKTLNDVESYGTCGEFSFVPSLHLSKEEEDLAADIPISEFLADTSTNLVGRIIEERNKILQSKKIPHVFKVTGGVKRRRTKRNHKKRTKRKKSKRNKLKYKTILWSRVGPD